MYSLRLPRKEVHSNVCRIEKRIPVIFPECDRLAVVAALMALFGLYFYVYNLRQGYPYLYYTLSAITIIFMIAVPILTMRSFAENGKIKRIS